MSFLTCFWLFPQNEHLSRSPLSPIRATLRLLFLRSGFLARTITITAGTPISEDPGGRSAECPTATRVEVGRCGSDGNGLEGGQDPVDDPVLLGLLGGEVLVALDVA